MRRGLIAGGERVNSGLHGAKARQRLGVRSAVRHGNVVPDQEVASLICVDQVIVRGVADLRSVIVVAAGPVAGVGDDQDR